jgi:hypothetical protein
MEVGLMPTGGETCGYATELYSRCTEILLY